MKRTQFYFVDFKNNDLYHEIVVTQKHIDRNCVLNAINQRLTEDKKSQRVYLIS